MSLFAFKFPVLSSAGRYLGHPPFYYWMTYVLTILLPLAGFVYGIRKKDRYLIDISLLSCLLTLITNKSYLNIKRYDWDPMILGGFLLLLGIGALWWFSKGKNKTRNGLTSLNILKPETHGIDLASLGVFVMTPTPSAQPTSGSDPFSGGETGGGGASRSF